MAVYLGSNQVNMLGGGGGSSDFSTATVTVTSQKQPPWGISLIAPVILDDDEWFGTCIYSDWSVSSIGNPTPFQVVLYKGETKASVYSQEGDIISVSGDATFDGSELTITGDCTITVS